MLPVARVIGHKEWTGRKIDPLVDMNWRRNRVANFAPGGDDVSAEQVWSYPVSRGNAPGGKVPAIQELADAKSNTIQILADLKALAGKSSAAVAVDPAAVAEALVANAKFVDALGESVAAKIAARLQS